MSGVCPCCGTLFDEGDYRCEGEINGTQCGKDLTDLDGSTNPGEVST